MRKPLLFVFFCFVACICGTVLQSSLNEAFSKETASEEATPALKILAAPRIDALAEKARSDWKEYLDRSLSHSIHERQILRNELASAGLDLSRPAPGNSKEFELGSKVTVEWLGSSETESLAQAILSYQTPTGGWSKAIDYTKGPRPTGTHWTSQSGKGWHYCGTLDNRSTTEQTRFLAWMNTVKPSNDYRQGAERGLRWLLEAQFPNGGWPQVYPLEPGYHEAITLNDSAMLHAIQLLLSAGERSAPFAWVDDTLRQSATNAAKNGIECLIRMRVMVDGKPTVWCAQHDPLSLEPVAARLKEPPSLSGGESADLLKFFMREAPDTPAIRNSIVAGVRWFDEHKIAGLRQIKNDRGKTDYVADPFSLEVYWARFYDLKTQQPIFAGAQDGIIYSTFSEMAKQNKVAYDYFTTRPRDIITKENERWNKRIGK